MNLRSSEPAASAEPPSRRKNSEYFDSDEEDIQQIVPPIASKNLGVRDDRKVPILNVASDNNFVDDDWDAEEHPSAPETKISHTSAVRTGGVAADANFATDDWDD
ncbi:hypothetical protein BBO99_00007405 [Phytophthora kernoviae]|uniref:Uncharacterized protein n=2 Tax=Phytophthora kernoviae TaxID=325452 RepID=A0A3R7MLY7_9STRA|nr:hypothetical protein G195_010371 [Phytophthora kernoviae 00238/432]KAG2511048.1 hypothetical protein JM18_008709 [Phytophthora kernoviae]KAG2511619.1 hypothetical protein JM16_007043 [Phytophthora kernoviae]RLN06819.1 hypothetical protein BBI17_007340 [Phytophthora kernoviae]RLN76621.1 hypothetical protein BBO99_00007405 [Phytophthora kernoviae]